MTAQYLHELQDEVLSVKKVCEITGFSESFVYHHSPELGGVKRCGRLFFSKRNVLQFIFQRNQ